MKSQLESDNRSLEAPLLKDTLSRLSADEQALLVGAIVGDGHLTLPQQGNSRLLLTHAERQLPYLEWKVGILSRFRPHVTWRLGRLKDPNDNHPFCMAVTMRSELFSRLRAIAYADGKKTVSQQILGEVRPLTLEVWVLDQGSAWGGRVRLHTERHDRDHSELIRDWLRTRYGFDARIVKAGRGKVRVSFTRRASLELACLVAPVLPVQVIQGLQGSTPLGSWLARLVGIGLEDARSPNAHTAHRRASGANGPPLISEERARSP